MAKRTKKLIENTISEDSIRLNKYLSDAGLCSRREADQYIASGEVTVDGVIAVTGTKVMPGQKVVFRGKPVNQNEKLILIAFNKPRGIVCTTDRREKDNIIDYINYGQRIYPIGRLDKDSEGIILLTNDGNIVNKILRAGNNHEKEYIVEINKPITSEFLKGMAEGVPILDTVTLPCQIKALGKTTFQIILTQGLNRQIRRMCEYYGYKVLSLKRVRIMNINLGYLQVGGYRNVTDKELAGLKELISDSVNTPQAIGEDNDEERLIARSTSRNVSTSSVASTSRNAGTSRAASISKNADNTRNESTFKNAGTSRKSYSKTNTKNSAFNNTNSKKSSDLEKTDYTSKTSDTKKSKYETKKTYSGKPSYGRKAERTEKPETDTKTAYSGKPSYGRKVERTEKPESNTKTAYSGKPSYGRKVERTEKPESDTKTAYSGKPSYGRKVERTEKPEYGTKTSYSGKSSYGKKVERTEKPVYDTKTKSSGRSTFDTKSDDASKSFKSFTKKSSNHSRNIDFNKPSDSRRNNGRQANTNQRAGRKTK